MILKKSHLEILNLFRKDIFLSKTIRELSFMVKKDYPTVYRAAKELGKKKIINIRGVGKANICEMSFSQEAISVFSFLEEQEALSRKIPNIGKILEFKEFLDDIIIIAGSYAKRKETKKSDMDIAVITKDKAFNKQKLFENLTDLILPRIHPVVITQEDFIKMLLDEKPNLGKEIFRNHLVFRSASRYYELLKEAVKNGFSG